MSKEMITGGSPSNIVSSSSFIYLIYNQGENLINLYLLGER